MSKKKPKKGGRRTKKKIRIFYAPATNGTPDPAGRVPSRRIRHPKQLPKQRTVDSARGVRPKRRPPTQKKEAAAEGGQIRYLFRRRLPEIGEEIAGEDDRRRLCVGPRAGEGKESRALATARLSSIRVSWGPFTLAMMLKD